MAYPVYLVILNLFGFLTLPLYALTPENRLRSKAFNALMNNDPEKSKTLAAEFEKKFKVNVPEEFKTDKKPNS